MIEMKRDKHEQIRELIRTRERSLEVMQKLLKLKLMTGRADLTVLVIYYRICNAIWRAAIKIA